MGDGDNLCFVVSFLGASSCALRTFNMAPQPNVVTLVGVRGGAGRYVPHRTVLFFYASWAKHRLDRRARAWLRQSSFHAAVCRLNVY